MTTLVVEHPRVCSTLRVNIKLNLIYLVYFVMESLNRLNRLNKFLTTILFSHLYLCARKLCVVSRKYLNMLCQWRISVVMFILFIYTHNQANFILFSGGIGTSVTVIGGYRCRPTQIHQFTSKLADVEQHKKLFNMMFVER